MVNAIVLVLAFLALLVGLSLLSWSFKFEGKVTQRNDSLDYSATVCLGGRKMGVSLDYRKGLRYLIWGPVQKPFVRIRLGTGKRDKRRKAIGKSSLKESWNKIGSLHLRKLTGQIWKSVKWESFQVKGEFGLGNPFATGQAFAIVMAIRGLIPQSVGTVEVTPDFTRKKLSFDCYTTFRTRPAVLAWRVGSLFLTRSH
ncbi:MAG: DUF2953 domain-containing protein [Candidatus Neomarinimicrobiota bacterium]